MKQVNFLFVIWWMAVSCSFSFTWSSSINGIFSARDFLDLTTGTDPNLLDAIANGAQLAMDECQSAFYWDRWNCPITDFSRKQKQHATREQAVIQSILSAGITHAIAKNCSEGLIPGCGCVPKQDVPTTTPYTKINADVTDQNGTTKVDFVLKGCVADIGYGATVSKNILDRQVTGKDIQAKINLHNNNLGRTLIKDTMIKKCRCHGVSGSCSMQTCWMELAPFSTIAKLIRAKYHRAERIELGNDNRLLSQNVEREIQNKSKSVLIFLGQSENHCLANNKTGWPGTKGRSCSRDKLETTTPAERKSCRHLCRNCGYKVRKVKRLRTWSCKCEFKWCCKVQCETCSEMVDEFYCQ